MALVLLVEDDERLALLVSDYLQANSLEVVHESVGHNVARQVKDLQPDIVILDLMLPGRDGLTVCAELRAFYPGPILILTARDSSEDQIRGLEIGADDYVVKPAEPRILLARICALLRRSQRRPEDKQENIRLGILSVDTANRRVELGEQRIDLSPHEFDLLYTFLRHQGEILSREYLFTKVYERAYDGTDRSIDVRVSQLRKKLDDAEAQQKIKTIWGRGYLLVADAWTA